MKTADLIEQRNTALHKMREAHGAENGDAFAAAETEIRAIDAKLERAKVLDAMDAAAQRPRDERFGSEIRTRYSYRKAMLAAMGDRTVDAGFERETDAELRATTGRTFNGFAVPTEGFERRVLTTAAPGGGPGSNLVADDFLANEYISALTASTVV